MPYVSYYQEQTQKSGPGLRKDVFNMDKQYALPLAAVLGGAAAFVLRLLQNTTGFEEETGLPIPGNLAGTALMVLLIAGAAALVWLARQLPGQEEEPFFPAEFAVESAGLLTLPVCGVFLIALSGLADLAEALGVLTLPQLSRHMLYGVLREGGLGFSKQGQILLGVLSLVSAWGLFLAASACRKRPERRPKTMPAWALLLPVGALVVRLVLTYRVDSVNPSLEMYYIELLALVFMTLAFYRLSSFAYNAGRSWLFGSYTGMTVLLCVASLADGGVYLSSLLLQVGGAVSLLGFLLLRICAGIAAEEDDGTIVGPAE